MNNHLKLIGALLVSSAFAAVLATGVALAKDAPTDGGSTLEVNRPNLDGYRLVSLTLATKELPAATRDNSAAFPPSQLYLGQIDGQLIQFWSTAETLASAKVEPLPGSPPNMERLDPLLVQLRERDASQLTMGTDAIRGTIRFGHRGLNQKLSYWVVFQVDAKVAGAKVSGTYSWKATKADKDHKDTGEVVVENSGTLTGTVATAAELAKVNSLAMGQHYLNWRGNGTGTAPKGGAALTENAEKVRMRWVSEDDMAGGWGMVAINFGGYSQPLVMSNRIYVAYFRPTVAKEATPAKFSREADCAPAEEAKFNVAEADEVMVCLDAATGVTLWKRAFIKDSFNHIGDAKYGPWLPPCIEDGRWFIEGVTENVYSLDTTTGNVLWRVSGGRNKLELKKVKTGALQVGDGVVLTSAGIGLDARTGQKVWGPSPLLDCGGRGNGPVGRLKWVHDGVSYFVSRDGCVRAKDGKECWKVPYAEPPSNPKDPGQKRRVARPLWPVLEGDMLVVPGRDAGDDQNAQSKIVPLPTTCYQMYPDRLEKRWELSCADLPMGLDHAPVIVDGLLYMLTVKEKSKGLLACVNLATGKIESLSPVMHDANSNFSNLFAQDGMAYIGGRGGRFLKLRPSGSSDLWIGQSSNRADNACLSRIDGYLYPVLLDGRLFRRSRNGYMACYDLREQQNQGDKK